MRNRLISLVLSMLMFVSILPMGAFAQTQENQITTLSSNAQTTGVLTSKVGFVYGESTTSIAAKNMVFSLLADGNVITQIPLTQQVLDLGSGTIVVGDATYNYTITLRGQNGEALTGVTGVYYVDIALLNIPTGNYNVKMDASGYTAYTSNIIELITYNQCVVFFTGENGFTIGDVNGDNAVNNSDLTYIEARLSAMNAYDASADLNGDGAVDIIDIALVNRHINVPQSQQTIFQTSVIPAAVVDTTEMETENAELTVEEGSLTDLFVANTQTVKLSQTEVISKEKPLALNIPMATTVEMQQVEIAMPTGVKVEEGKATVTYVDTDGTEKTEEVVISTIPSDVQAITKDGERNTVVIDLGKKVAVKKIVITVEKVTDANGETNYVAIDEITFIKDIVPENPKTDIGVVSGLQAVAGSSTISLSWGRVANITGYNVYIGTKNSVNIKDYEKAEMATTTSATITSYGGKKLENYTTYYVLVTSINGTWESGISAVLPVVPIPNAAPLAPDNVRLTAGDKMIIVNWQKTKDATSYNVYYKLSSETNYTLATQTPITSLEYYVGGLTNGKSYDVCVTAVNDIGESSKSLVNTATPIKIHYDDPGVPRYNQIAPETINTVKLQFADNVDNSFYPNGFNIRNVVDGDFSTHWTARRWWENTTIEFTFNDAHTMDHVVWVARMDGNYPNSFDNYTITVWGENDDVTKAGTVVAQNAKPVTFSDPVKGKYMVFSFPKTNVKKINISTAMWAGAPTNMSASEVLFYDYYSLVDDITALFADNTFTSLKAGVTQANIDTIKAQLDDTNRYYVDATILKGELELAQSLLNGDTSKLGKVINGVESMNGMQTLGVTALAGSKILVYADIPQGETVSINATQFFGESSAWKSESITLHSGRNIITVPKIGTLSDQRGGPLYFTYKGSKASEIKLHVKSYATNTNIKNLEARNMPVLDLYNWDTMSEEARRAEIERYITELTAYVPTVNNNTLDVRNTTEISLPNVLLSIPAGTALSGIQSGLATMDEKVQRLYDNTLAWNELLSLMYTTNGVKTEDMKATTRENIRYMRMFANAFMYAAGSHVGVGYNSTVPLVQGRPTSVTGEGNASELFGWGIAHEIGHNKDTIGYAEITNNIYAQFAMAKDGNLDINTTRVPFDEVYRKVTSGQEGQANNGFVQLGMYWQLHLAYDGKYENQTDNFYFNFNQLWKAGEYSNLSKTDRIAAVASKAAGKDLTDFFTRWGFVLSSAATSAMSQFEAESRAIYYFDDAARAYRLQNGTDISAISPLTTSISQDDKGNITVAWSGATEDEINALQGFEIVRNGIAIAFAKAGETSYVDVVGAANNIAYNYEIVPITKLGSRLAAVTVGQQKVSYDAVIERDTWSYGVDENGDIQVSFTTPQSIAGLRVSNFDTVGASGTMNVTGVLANQDLEQTPPSNENSSQPTSEETSSSSSQSQSESASSSEEASQSSQPQSEATSDETSSSAAQSEINSTSTSEESSSSQSTESLTIAEGISISLEGQEFVASQEVVASEEPVVSEETKAEEEIVSSEVQVEAEQQPQQTEEVLVQQSAATKNVASTVLTTGVTLKNVNFAVNDTTDANKFINYFNKPGADATDTRIWTYDVQHITISGYQGDVDTLMENLDFIQYPGDNIELDINAMGLLLEDFVYDDTDPENGTIKKDTLIVTGTYRGDPVYNNIRIQGKFMERSTTAADEITIVERAMAGTVIMFAEIPADGEVSETSDGFWIFIPDVQSEHALQGSDAHACAESIMPAEIKASLYRSTTPGGESQFLTSDTVWSITPSYETMPYIKLN